jgi:hypothetical protein
VLTEGIRTTDRPAEFQPAAVFPFGHVGRSGRVQSESRVDGGASASPQPAWVAGRYRNSTEPGTSSWSDNAGIPATADPARVSCLCSCPTSVCVPDEDLRQLFRAAERDAVAGQDLVWRDVQALGD